MKNNDLNIQEFLDKTPKDPDLLTLKYLDLPPAKKPNNKFFLFCTNYFDGIGDYYHLSSIGKKAKQVLQDKGYEVCVVLEIYTQSEVDESHDINVRANTVKNLLKKENFFDKYWIYDHDLSNSNYTIEKWLENEEELQNYLSQSCGSLSISYISNVNKIVPTTSHNIECLQYGSNYDLLYTNYLKKAPLGLFGNSLCYGIELFPNNMQLQGTEKLSSLQKNESVFLTHLIGKEISEKNMIDYTKEHYFFPAYLQTTSSACAFILSSYYSHTDKPCDFFIPKNVCNPNAIKNMLMQKAGLDEKDIAFITKETKDLTHVKAKVRIFSFKIEDQEDYNSLYQINSCVAGGSGDNSLSTVFSSPNLPYFAYKKGVIGDFYKQLPGFISVRKWHVYNSNENKYEDAIVDSYLKANKLEKNDLLQGLEQLTQYFNHMTLYLSLGVATNPDILQTKVPNDPESVKFFSEAQCVLSNDFNNWCKELSDLQKQDKIMVGWRYIQQLIKDKYNFFNHLENILKSSIYLTAVKQDNKELLLSTLNKVLQDNSILQTEDMQNQSKLDSAKGVSFMFENIKSNKHMPALNKLALDKLSCEKLIFLTTPTIQIMLINNIVSLQDLTYLLQNSSLFKKPNKAFGYLHLNLLDTKIYTSEEQYSAENEEIYKKVVEIEKSIITNIEKLKKSGSANDLKLKF